MLGFERENKIESSSESRLLWVLSASSWLSLAALWSFALLSVCVSGLDD